MCTVLSNVPPAWGIVLCYHSRQGSALAVGKCVDWVCPPAQAKISSHTVNPGSTEVKQTNKQTNKQKTKKQKQTNKKTITGNIEGQNWTSRRISVYLFPQEIKTKMYHMTQKALGSAVWANWSECFPPSQSVSVRKSMCSLNEKWFQLC